MLKTLITPELYQYCLDYGINEPPVLAQLREVTRALHKEQLLISREQGSLMAIIAQLMGASRYLEIGTFTGYSTLWVALALPSYATVTTLDISADYLELAKAHWQQAGVFSKITSLIAPARASLELLLTQNDRFDLAFIDANKSEYLSYYEACIRLVRPGGLILIDNTLMAGTILTAVPAKKYVKTIQHLNKLLKQDARVDICLLPIGDGLTLARKKDHYAPQN